jgi:hypothetical protein
MEGRRRRRRTRVGRRKTGSVVVKEEKIYIYL